VRLPEGDVPALKGVGVSKSVASRHFVALSAARVKERVGADRSGLDIMVVQIDGIHISCWWQQRSVRRSPRRSDRSTRLGTSCLSPALHVSFRRALRQAWELDGAEKLIRNLAQRLERDALGVSKSILEGLDEVLTLSRLGLPAELRRSVARANIIENMMGTLCETLPRRLLCWIAAEAKKGFRRPACSPRLLLTTSFTAAPASQTSTKNGAIPE
jgi:hypothetical protein